MRKHKEILTFACSTDAETCEFQIKIQLHQTMQHLMIFFSFYGNNTNVGQCQFQGQGPV